MCLLLSVLRTAVDGVVSVANCASWWSDGVSLSDGAEVTGGEVVLAGGM